jgi:hypothetical protein
VKARVVKDDMENFNEQAKKFYDLLKDADKPFHEKIKHNKLWAIVRLYSLKCMGG